MPSENSVSQSSKFKAVVALTWMADAGQLDGLPCPQCHEASVAVWFSHVEKDEYRTWFICDKCGFYECSIGSRPRHYVKERDIKARKAVET